MRGLLLGLDKAFWAPLVSELDSLDFQSLAEQDGPSAADPASLVAVLQDRDYVVWGVPLELAQTPPPSVLEAIVAGSENVIQARRQAGCKQLICLSSAEAFRGPANAVFWDERRSVTQPPETALLQALKLAEELCLATSDVAFVASSLRIGWLHDLGPRAAQLATEAAQLGQLGCGWRYAPMVAVTSRLSLARAIEALVELRPAGADAFYVDDGAPRTLPQLAAPWAPSLRFELASRSPAATWTLPQAFRAIWGGRCYEELRLRRYASHFDSNKARATLGWQPYSA